MREVAAVAEIDISVAIAAMLVCLAVEAFFSGSEIAVVSADRMKLRQDAANGSKGAALALKMLERPEWLLSTSLVGTNAAVVTNTTIATGLAIHLLGDGHSWVAVALVTPLIWIFGEIVAKSVAQQHANVITPRAIYVLRVASAVFWPILAVFALLSRALASIMGGPRRNPFTMREEIRSMIEMSPAEDDIRPEEKRMIHRVFSFGETTAGEIMVPLIDVIAIERRAKTKEAIAMAVERAHKRLPVYDQRVDKIIGTLNTLDLLTEDDASPIEPFVRPVMYVPPSKNLEDLLVAFRSDDEHTAVVVDEFGGAEGIVMLEDILEEVVGDLQDEFDSTVGASPKIQRISRNHYIVSARVEIETFNETLGLTLPEGDYETVAGFLIKATGEIPDTGDVIKHDNITFTIVDATQQAIREVRVRW
jgi:CBS domain containing-hemolysin-like protein